MSGTVGETFAKKSDLINNDLIVLFSSNETRIKALEEGAVDAIIMHFSLQNHLTLRTLAKPLSQSYYGVVSRLEDDKLMGKVNRPLRELKRSGRIVEIKRSYYD